MLALATPAVAQDDSACPRPPQGSPIQPPQDLYSKDGVLSLSFDYRTRLDSHNRTLFCFMTPEGAQSPALHVLPGDTLRIRLTDKVPDPSGAMDAIVSGKADRCGASRMTPASVNIHYHGTNTSPTCHQDEVIHTLVNSGETFTYALHIPPDEPPGLYWYHTHVHGLNNASLLGGASGPLVVEGIEKYQPEVKGLPQRILAFRDERKANLPRDLATPTAPSFDVSLNYVPVIWPRDVPGILRMHAGQKEFWRVVNASADTSADLQLLYDGVAQPLEIVAFDSYPLGWAKKQYGETLTQKHVFLAPAGRAEFIVTGPSERVRNAVLVTLPGHTGPQGFSEPKRPLAVIRTTHDIGWLPGAPERSASQDKLRFEQLADAPATAKRTLYFSEDAKQMHFFITVEGQKPVLYYPGEPPRITTTQGAIEDWTIENRTREVHAFHIHQIHFLLLALDGKPVPKKDQQLFDTHELEFWTGKGPYPSITVRMDFRGPIAGEFVYHCHIADHSDNGMMANIRVLPKTGGQDASAHPAL